MLKKAVLVCIEIPIDSLLDITKLEAGTLILNPAAFAEWPLLLTPAVSGLKTVPMGRVVVSRLPSRSRQHLRIHSLVSRKNLRQTKSSSSLLRSLDAHPFPC